MIDAIVAILAAITGTDDGGIESHGMPECFKAPEYASTDCVSTDSPNPYYIDANAKLHLIYAV